LAFWFDTQTSFRWHPSFKVYQDAQLTYNLNHLQ
jgi:hypothetical protein